MSMTTKQFVNRHRITADVEWADHNPNMDDERGTMNHFKVTLRCGRRRMTLYFSQGFGISGEPQPADILECLASDASGAEQSFEDWCSDLGFDSDSRKAERTYKAVQTQTEKLRKLLGDTDFSVLVYGA